MRHVFLLQCGDGKISADSDVCGDNRSRCTRQSFYLCDPMNEFGFTSLGPFRGDGIRGSEISESKKIKKILTVKP